MTLQQAPRGRSLKEIDADLHQCRKLCAELQAERRDFLKSRDREILRLFDDEQQDSWAIARMLDLPLGKARAILHRNGRTKRGRDAIRAQLATLSPPHHGVGPSGGQLAAGTQSPSGAGGSFFPRRIP